MVEMFTSVVFLIGVVGIVRSKNIIMIVIAVEMLMLAVNMKFIMGGVSIDDIAGGGHSMMVLTVVASESVVSLGLLVIIKKVKGTITTQI